MFFKNSVEIKSKFFLGRLLKCNITSKRLKNTNVPCPFMALEHISYQSEEKKFKIFD